MPLTPITLTGDTKMFVGIDLSESKPMVYERRLRCWVNEDGSIEHYNVYEHGTHGEVYYHEVFPDGREAVVVQENASGLSRIKLGSPHLSWYDDVWEYTSVRDAVCALKEWDGSGGEPSGWTRHPASGRRRPNGDASKQYIRE